MSTTRLPHPGDTYFFRNTYLPEAIHRSRQAVAERYADQPIVAIINGDFRGKDAFSLRCVEVEAACQNGAPESEALTALDTWRPITRRDCHPDALSRRNSIPYEPDDMVSLARATRGSELTTNAARRANRLLGERPPLEGQVRLPDAWINSLGPLEQVDVSEPLLPAQKRRIPSVQSTQNMWNYFELEPMNQFAQNLQDTQAQGSYLVVGLTEAASMSMLQQVLQRHGYTPDVQSNEITIGQMKSNPILNRLQTEYVIDELGPLVYQKTEPDPLSSPRKEV